MSIYLFEAKILFIENRRFIHYLSVDYGKERKNIMTKTNNLKRNVTKANPLTFNEIKSKLIKMQNSYHAFSHPQKTAEQKNYTFWLNEWLSCKRLSVKESTFMHYKNIVENHIRPALGKYIIEEISTSLLEQFLYQKLQKGKLDGSGGLSPKSVSDILVVIKESFKYAQSYGVISVCNFDGISLKKNNKEMRVLSLSEEQRLNKVLLNDIDRYKLGVFICLYTGIRIGELCALRWRNISVSEKTLKVEHTMQRIQTDKSDISKKTKIVITEPKSFSAHRIIPLPDFVLEIIGIFVGNPEAYVLSGKSDVVIEPRTMQNKFKFYLEKADINAANFHSLRHTFATRCIESDFDVKTLSEILGHSSVKITLDKYVHSSMNLKRNNMAKLKPAIL